MRGLGPANLDESAVLKGQQLFVDEREWKPQEIGQILSGPPPLDVQNFEQEIADCVRG
jgi:hypothetical protein